MKDDLIFEEMQNLGVSHNLGLSHGRSCKALSHPVDSKEQDEEALEKSGHPESPKNLTWARNRSGPVPSVRLFPPYRCRRRWQ